MEIAAVKAEYSKAAEQAAQFEPIFKQFQKLAGNVTTRRFGNNPFPYGEGTAASIIRKLPQRMLKQMPAGKRRNISNEFMAIMCEFIVQEIFFRFARRNEGILQSLWNLVENGEVYGFCTVTPFFTRINGVYTVDWRMHYWGDVMPVPGVKNINGGDVFIRDWWSKEDVKALIKAADDDDTLNKKALKAILEGEETSRDSGLQSETNIRASVSNLGYEVIRYYVLEDGKYKLYIFRPGAGDFIQEKELPGRGHVTFYCNFDDLTAYGRSILGLIGGIQMDLDQAQQSRRKVQQLEVDHTPPPPDAGRCALIPGRTVCSPPAWG
jgi:hypothetical protein